MKPSERSLEASNTLPDLPTCPTCGCPEAQDFTRVYLCGSVWSQDDDQGDHIEIRTCGPVGEYVTRLREAFGNLLDETDGQFCQGEIYNEGGDEQLDCGKCAWCLARTALGRPEINV